MSGSVDRSGLPSTSTTSTTATAFMAGRRMSLAAWRWRRGPSFAPRWRRGGLHVRARLAPGLGPGRRARAVTATAWPSDHGRRRIPHPRPRLGARRALAYARAGKDERRAVGPQGERPRTEAPRTPRARLHEPAGMRLIRVREDVTAARVVAPRIVERVAEPRIAAVAHAEAEAPAITAVAAPAPRTAAPAAREVRVVERIGVPAVIARAVG